MVNNANVNKSPRSFLYYKEEYYINGTEIILSDEYINNNFFNGKKLWQYARFDHRIQCNGKSSYFFYARKFDFLSFHEMNIDINNRKDYTMYFIIDADKIENAIYKITKPIKLTNEEDKNIKLYISNLIEHPKTDLDYPELIVGWTVYTIIMIASLIFNQFYFIWLIASYIFFVWRKDILE